MIITTTGWTWETVDDMIIPQVTKLVKYWKANPPLHLMVAAYLGIKGENEPAVKMATEEDIKSLVAAFGAH